MEEPVFGAYVETCAVLPSITEAVDVLNCVEFV